MAHRTCVWQSTSKTNPHSKISQLHKTNQEVYQLDDIRGGDIEYHTVKNDDRWTVSVIKKWIDVKFGRLDVDGFSADELEEICYYFCISWLMSFRGFSEGHPVPQKRHGAVHIPLCKPNTVNIGHVMSYEISQFDHLDLSHPTC